MASTAAAVNRDEDVRNVDISILIETKQLRANMFKLEPKGARMRRQHLEENECETDAGYEADNEREERSENDDGDDDHAVTDCSEECPSLTSSSTEESRECRTPDREL